MNYDRMIPLKSRMAELQTRSFLDVACGKGEFLKFAIQSFHGWICAAGIDINAGALQIAAKEFKNSPVILVIGSAFAMPFPDESFDTITLSNSLHHLEDTDALFSEMKRVCTPGGMILINEMLNEGSSAKHENHMLYHHFMAEVDTQLGHYHRETYTEKELHVLIKTSGLPVNEYFVHEETNGNQMIPEEIEQMAMRLGKKVELLRSNDCYYFYENKAREIIERIRAEGINKPRHITFILNPGK